MYLSNAVSVFAPPALHTIRAAQAEKYVIRDDDDDIVVVMICPIVCLGIRARLQMNMRNCKGVSIKWQHQRVQRLRFQSAAGPVCDQLAP